MALFLLEVFSPLNGSRHGPSVPLYVGVNCSTCSLCVSLDSARLACEPVSRLTSDELRLERLLPGRRRLAVSLLGLPNEVVVDFFVTGSNTDITAAVGADPWTAAVPFPKLSARADYFDAVYATKYWSSGKYPASGPGSSKESAKNAVVALERVIAGGIKTLVDAPCGDLTWIFDVTNLPEEYIGLDVSKDIIERNRLRFPQYSFDHVDLVDRVLQLDNTTLILTRHLLFHLPLQDNLKLLNNLVESGAGYLLTSTYLEADENLDSYVLANGHKINLLRPPYSLREPDLLFRDSSDDQYLGLWDLQSSSLFKTSS